jgi:hypothetical protein
MTEALMPAHPQLAGPLFVTGAKPEGLVSGHAYRDKHSGGVRIHSFSVGSWLPPDVSIITQNLTAKTYDVRVPLELFVYAVHDEPNGAVGSLEQMDACVATHLIGSIFKRVHLLHFFSVNTSRAIRSRGGGKRGDRGCASGNAGSGRDRITAGRPVA